MLENLLSGVLSYRAASWCQRGLLTLLLLTTAVAAFAQTTIYGLGVATYDVINPATGVQLYPAGTPLLIPISPTTGAPTDPATGIAYSITYVPSTITGVTAGQVLVGIDYRPNNGLLYGLGYNPATGATQLYTITPGASGTPSVATTVSATPVLLDLGQAGTSLSSKRIGFDFNPAADRIRVVSTNGRNYRLNPDNGALLVQDGNLAYSGTVGTPVATPVAITTGTPVPTIPAAPGVGSVAYTNSTLGAGSTTLYDYDELNGGIISIQNLPNSGTLTAPTRSTFYITGSGQPGPYALATNIVALDIDVYYNRSTSQNVAYLLEVTDDRPSGYDASNLYSLNLANGQASRIGNIIPSTPSPLNPNAPLVPIDVYDIATAITAPLIWSGFVSDEWGNAANWVPQRVPTSADDVFIPGTYTPGATLLASSFPGIIPTPNQPTVRSGQSARSVALNTGATLTLVSGGTLNVYGDFSNTGGTVAGGGTGLVALVGTSAQSVGGSTLSTFPNLSVGTATASITGPAAIQSTGGLTLNGNLAITAGQSFTLLSNASGTAYVVNNGTAAVSGAATVQRYITPNLNPGPGYRHYSTPVSGNTVADFATSGFAPTVNPAYNSSATPPTTVPFPTVYFYDQSRLGLTNTSPEFDKGFASPNSLADPLIPTSGYTVNIPGTELVDFVGTLNNGSYSRVGLVRGPQATAGYQLLGNPYPGAINYDVVRASSTGIENALYVFKSNGQYTGTYTSYVNGASANTGTNILPVAQGFFVRVATGQTAAVNFTNAARLNAPDNTLFQRTTADPRPRLALTLRNAAVANQTVVYFEQGATAGFDTGFDAHYLPATHGLDLATDISTEALSINGLPALTSPTTVALHLHAPVAGTYTLAVDELLNLPAGYHAYLRDALTGTYTDLATTPSVPLTLAPTDAPTGRYAVVFGTAQPLAAASAATAQLVSLYPNPAHGTVQLLLPQALRTGTATPVALVDNLGRTVLTRQLSATADALELPLGALAPGIYSVQAQTNAGVVAKRLVVE
jgi:hypothetical protein